MKKAAIPKLNLDPSFSSYTPRDQGSHQNAFDSTTDALALITGQMNSLAIGPRDTALSHTEDDRLTRAFYDDAIMRWLTLHSFQQTQNKLGESTQDSDPEAQNSFVLTSAKKKPHWLRLRKPNADTHSALFAGTHSIKLLPPETINDFFTHVRNDIRMNFKEGVEQTRDYQVFFQLCVNRAHWVVMIINIHTNDQAIHKDDDRNIQIIPSEKFDELIVKNVSIEIYDPMKASQDPNNFMHLNGNDNSILKLIKQTFHGKTIMENQCMIERVQTCEAYNCGPFCLEITRQILGWHFLGDEITIEPNSGGDIRNHQFAIIQLENKRNLIQGLITDERANAMQYAKAVAKKETLIANNNADKINSFVNAVETNKDIFSIISTWNNGHCDNMPELKKRIFQTNDPLIISTLLKLSKESKTHEVSNEIDKYEFNCSACPSYDIYLNKLENHIAEKVEKLINLSTQTSKQTDKTTNFQVLTNFLNHYLETKNDAFIDNISDMISDHLIKSFTNNRYSKEECQFYYDIVQQIMSLHKENEISSQHTKALFNTTAVTEVLNYFHQDLRVDLKHKDMLTRICARSLFMSIENKMTNSFQMISQTDLMQYTIRRNKHLGELKLPINSFIKTILTSAPVVKTLIREVFKLITIQFSTGSHYDTSYQNTLNHLVDTKKILKSMHGLFESLAQTNPETRSSADSIYSAIHIIETMLIQCDRTNTVHLRLKNSANHFGLLDIIKEIKSTPSLLQMLFNEDINDHLSTLEAFTEKHFSEYATSPLKEYIHSLHSNDTRLIHKKLIKLHAASLLNPPVYTILFSPTGNDGININSQFSFNGPRAFLPAKLIIKLYTKKHFPLLLHSIEVWKRYSIKSNQSKFSNLRPSKKPILISSIYNKITSPQHSQSHSSTSSAIKQLHAIFIKIISNEESKRNPTALQEFHYEIERYLSFRSISYSNLHEAIPSFLNTTDKDTIKRFFSASRVDIQTYKKCIHIFNWVSLYIELKTKISEYRNCFYEIASALSSISFTLQQELTRGIQQNTTPIMRLNYSSLLFTPFGITPSQLLISIIENKHIKTMSERFNLEFLIKKLYKAYIKTIHDNPQPHNFLTPDELVKHLFISFDQKSSQRHAECMKTLETNLFDTDAVELIALLLCKDQKAVYYSNEAKDPDSSTAMSETIPTLLNKVHSQLNAVIMFKPHHQSHNSHGMFSNNDNLPTSSDSDSEELRALFE